MEAATWGGDSVWPTARVRDGDLLAFPASSVTQRLIRLVIHPASFITHTTCSQAGALMPILGAHLNKLMCMEMVTGGTIRHGQQQDTTARCGGKRGLRGMDGGGFEAVVFGGISGFSPVTGSQRNASVGGTHYFYDPEPELV